MTANDLIKDLNKPQQEAVKTTDGPILIIAGAGSGKTRVITRKVAYLIEKGVKPEEILALTFTDKASSEMLERVSELVESSGDLNVTTFHAFCKEIIADNILDLKMNADMKIIEDTAQLVWFIKNIDSFGMEHIEIGSRPTSLVGEIKKTISKFKDECITVPRLEKHIESKSKESLEEEGQENLNHLKDILKVYKAYELYKEENNMIDFGDMLIKVYDLLKSKPLILKKCQEKFKYILVDEFQDTNYIQLQIVNLLADKHKNITIVGDDDQSIYRFRGAYLTNIAEFKEHYKDHKEIFLEQNYRCTKRILNTANDLIVNKPDRIVKKLFTENEEGDKVTVAECKTDEDQAHYIVKEIIELLKTHDYKDIAILTRRKKGVQPIVDLFNKHKIPYEFVGNSDFFREPIIKDIVAYIRAISEPLDSPVEIARILHRSVFDIKPVEIARFMRHAHKSKISAYESFEKLEEVSLDKDKFEEVYLNLQKLIKAKTKLKLPELIYMLLFKVDFYKYELSMGNTKNISLLNQFFKLVSDYYNLHSESELHNFVEYMEYASNFEIKEDLEATNNVIQVMTIHASKGKEFPIVFIPDLVRSKFPTNMIRDKFVIPVKLTDGIKIDTDDKELHVQEERRLFYVAMTRAEKRLYLTHAIRYGDNKRDSKISPFMDEINYSTNENIDLQQIELDPIEIKEDSIKEQLSQKYIKEIVADLHMKHFSKVIPKVMMLDKIQGNNPSSLLKGIKELDYKSVMKQIEDAKIEKEKELEEIPTFSVSQFNTYNRCPRIYRYSYVFRLPTPAKPYFDFGSTIHKVCEELTKDIMDGEEVSIELALQYLEAYWKNEGYSSETEEQQAKEESKHILQTFLDEQSKMKTKIVALEKKFIIKIGDYNVLGYIDRIDQDGDDYIIFDYKTAKEVTSKNKLKEDIQLLTYDLAVQDLFKKRPKEVGLWFLRKNKKVMVEPNDEDVEKIKKQVLETIKKIIEEDYTPTPGCVCGNCDYKLLCDAWK